MFENIDIQIRGHSERSSGRAQVGRNAVEESREFETGVQTTFHGILRLRVAPTFAHDDTPLRMTAIESASQTCTDVAS